MKEIIYMFAIILICVIIYRKRFDINLVFVVFPVLALCIHAINFKYKTKEHFEVSKSMVFDDANFMEPMLMNTSHFDWQKYLTIYVSSFNKKLIDFETNTIKNVVSNSEIAALAIDDIRDSKGNNNFEQSKGFRISNPIYGPSPVDALNDSVNTFSFFWYMKLNIGKSDFTPERRDLYSLIRFNSKNLSGPNSNRNKFFEIRLLFHSGNLNPDIIINVLGSPVATYTYKSEDYFDKWFCDGNYHLFTFTKNETAITFCVDDHVLIDSQIEDTLFTREFSEGETSLKLDKIIKINDPVDDVRNLLKFNLLAFGTISEYALSIKNITDLLLYYNEIRKELAPEYLHMKRENKKLKHELKEYNKKCPFKNNTLCTSYQCEKVSDWNNFNEILNDKDCFKFLSEYCNTVTDLEGNKICNYIKSDNIMRMASTIDSNLFNYNSENIKTNIENKNILKELQRLGLKDIYLDKSLRSANGNTNNEMNRLINDLLKTNQTVDIDALNALHTKRDTTNDHDSLDYNRIFGDDDEFSNESEFQKLYNKMLSEDVTKLDGTETGLDIDKVDLHGLDNKKHNTQDDILIDLNYEDVNKPNVYDHVIKKHKEKSLLHATNSWGIFDLFK